MKCKIGFYPDYKDKKCKECTDSCCFIDGNTKKLLDIDGECRRECKSAGYEGDLTTKKCIKKKNN